MAGQRVLEIGAGQSPDPRATETLDIREDLDHIDYGGVDIGTDRWPVDANSIDLVVANHVLEHVPPNLIGHVFKEVNRVVKSGGKFHALVPHAGSWQAATDLTHYGSGGWTPDVVQYFSGDLEEYFPDMTWHVSARANLSFPLFIREELRIMFSVSRGDISHELMKIPFVSGEVEFEVTVV